MNAADLTHYLYQNIPLAKASAIEIFSVNNHSATAVAPLEANCNPHQTAFGGSQYVVGLSCAWMLVFNWLVKEGLANDYRLVIREGKVVYKKPIAKQLKAKVEVSDHAREDFLQSLLNGENKVSIALQVELNDGASRLDLELVSLKTS